MPGSVRTSLKSAWKILRAGLNTGLDRHALGSKRYSTKMVAVQGQVDFPFREILVSLPVRLLLNLDYVGQTYIGLVKRNCSPFQHVILSKGAVL